MHHLCELLYQVLIQVSRNPSPMLCLRAVVAFNYVYQLKPRSKMGSRYNCSYVVVYLPL